MGSKNNINVFNQLAEIPLPTSAQFIGNSYGTTGSSTVQVAYSVRDQTRYVKRTMSKTIFVPGQSGLDSVASPLADFGVITQSISPLKNLRAVWRAASDKRFVEIWKGSRPVLVADVSDFHGDFYADEYISSFSWSYSERAVIYTAERKPPADKKDYMSRFRFNPDFGEGFTGKRKPTTFILTWDDSLNQPEPSFLISEVQIDSDNAQVNGEAVRFGQFVFSPNSDTILYATGYEFNIDGRLLGPLGCFNRPTGIWQVRLSSLPKPGDDFKSPDLTPADVTKLTPSDVSCRSPRTFSDENGQSRLIWLGCATGGSHVSTSTLHSLDISSDDQDSNALPQPTVLADVVHQPTAGGFPGLYPPYNLPSRPFTLSGSGKASVALQSQWGSRSTVLLVSLEDGAIQDVSEELTEPYSWNVLATDGQNKLLCSRSCASVPYEIILGTISDDGKVAWNILDMPDILDDIKDLLSTLRTSILRVSTSRGDIETIVIQSGRNTTNDNIPPCITYPHGGPHASFTTAFSSTNTALVLEGYTINMPNYIGSLGFGDSFVHGLLGHCGEYDLEDTMSSIHELVKRNIAVEGLGKQMIAGGSHGGFITAHLIGTYPDFFSAATLRNPVILSGDVSSTDIPDWYFFEFGLHYPLKSLSPLNSRDEPRREQIPPLVTDDIYARLQAASPIRNLDKIHIPVTVLIGGSDRRVSNIHGIAFYHALKARYAVKATEEKAQPTKVEMLVFEGEGHPLDGVEASTVVFQATRDLFAEARR